jgi:hypothetical protein
MPKMPCDAHLKWVNGFKLLAEQWPKVAKFAAGNNRPGRWVIASTDDHLGYPGTYGEGLTGVYARDLTRASLNRQWMGSVVPFSTDRDVEVSVSGMDEIERVDVFRDGRVICRNFPADTASEEVR